MKTAVGAPAAEPFEDLFAFIDQMTMQQAIDLYRRLMEHPTVNECTCGRIVLNAGRETVARDWHTDCPEHGETSAWYIDHGRAYFEARRLYTRELQALAREARQTGKSQSHRLPPIPRFEDF